MTVPVGKIGRCHVPPPPGLHPGRQTGCVIAYSSFPTQPPKNSLFGRPGQGVSLQSGQTASKGLEVACVNPAAIARWDRRAHAVLRDRPRRSHRLPRHDAVGDVSRPLHSVVPERRRCELAPGHLADPRREARRHPVPGADVGVPPDDINLALGNLVADVRAAESTLYGGGHCAGSPGAVDPRSWAGRGLLPLT